MVVCQSLSGGSGEDEEGNKQSEGTDMLMPKRNVRRYLSKEGASHTEKDERGAEEEEVL